jgi:hypothetical protein
MRFFTELMKNLLIITCATALILNPGASARGAGGKPFEGGKFKGRIAYSADGNHNDPDDWAASPVALAIFAAAGVRDRLVHFDYNCILPETNVEWEKIHEESVLGGADAYGYDRSLFFDCRKNLDKAVAGIAKVINDSTAEDPLYFIVAGPMEVPYMGIQKSDPNKRRFVYCISHSRWNDGYASKYKFTHSKRSVIEQDVNWLQIRDQNRLLSLSPYGKPAKPEEFAGFFWMRDSHDPKVEFLWKRTLISTRPDPSDAGMAYFLVTGDEECSPSKLKSLIEDHVIPRPVSTRKQVRLEAENFRNMDHFVVDDRNDKNASHRLHVVLTGGESGSIRTRYDEPFAPAGGRCDVDIRFFDEKNAKPRIVLSVAGMPQGSPWESAGEGRGWTTQTIRGVEIRAGQEIKLEVQGGPCKLDYVQLNY